MGRHVVTLYALERGGAEECLERIGQALAGGTVGTLDSNGMVELELTADTREQALGQVRDAVAAAGADDRFTFPGTTGTHFVPQGRRAAPPDEQPSDG